MIRSRPELRSESSATNEDCLAARAEHQHDQYNHERGRQADDELPHHVDVVENLVVAGDQIDSALAGGCFERFRGALTDAFREPVENDEARTTDEERKDGAKCHDRTQGALVFLRHR